MDSGPFLPEVVFSCILSQTCAASFLHEPQVSSACWDTGKFNIPCWGSMMPAGLWVRGSGRKKEACSDCRAAKAVKDTARWYVSNLWLCFKLTRVSIWAYRNGGKKKLEKHWLINKWIHFLCVVLEFISRALYMLGKTWTLQTCILSSWFF